MRLGQDRLVWDVSLGNAAYGQSSMDYSLSLVLGLCQHFSPVIRSGSHWQSWSGEPGREREQDDRERKKFSSMFPIEEAGPHHDIGHRLPRRIGDHVILTMISDVPGKPKGVFLAEIFDWFFLRSRAGLLYM